MDQYRVCGKSLLAGTHSACALYELGDLARPRGHITDCVISGLIDAAEDAVRLLQSAVLQHVKGRRAAPHAWTAPPCLDDAVGDCSDQDSLISNLREWSYHLRVLDGASCIGIQPERVRLCARQRASEEGSTLGTHQDSSDHSKALGKTGLTTSFAWSKKPTQGGAALLTRGPDGRYPESVLEAEEAITFSLNDGHRGAELVIVSPHDEGGSYYVGFLGSGGTWHRSVGACDGSRVICYTGEDIVRASQLEKRAAAEGVPRACWSEVERKCARGLALHHLGDDTLLSEVYTKPSDAISVDFYKPG